MFGFSGSALVAQAGNLVSNFWVPYNTSTTSNILQLAILNQILNLLQHSKSKVCLCQGIIFLKLAIWALNYSIGMFGAGASFLKFSISGIVTLDKSKCVQTLKLEGVNLEIWMFVDFNATWKPVE